ncbi:MAG: kelch repeat-containing protein [Acidobacteriota bacterium]
MIQFVVATLLATALYANHPSPRLYPAMAFDEQAGAGVLFGGRGLADGATGLIHATDETWLWVAQQWVQQFPATHPPSRSTHAMTYDSKRNRVILFGGRKESTVLLASWGFYNDTWAWQNGQWEQLVTSSAPTPREYAGMTYDRVRDRVILFGGYNYKEDGKTVQALNDTWELDGQNWAQVSNAGPTSNKPLLAFDEARHETIMLGNNDAIETLMYRWDPASSSWQKLAPSALPPCVNEGSLAYEKHNERLVLVGGLCSTATPITDETWEWDGTNWAKLETTLTTRYTGAAVAYDAVAEKLVRFGGLSAFASTPDSSTYTYRDLVWRFRIPVANPGPRSFPVFRRDPERNVVWLLGGLSEFSTSNDSIFYNDDQWRFQNGQWSQEGVLPGTPSQCATPLSTFDTDRKVLIVVCGGGSISEFDGTAWKEFGGLSDTPDPRRFAGLAYDQNLKKTVYFGGYDGLNYRDDTWTWDGTKWTKVKTKDEPENRGQMTMWYDPLAKKTILFSGVGRPNIDQKVTRFEDMWSFDGSTWVKLTVTATPGIRFGAQVAVDPRDGKALLFGGLRAIVDGKLVDQFYANDLWSWDGGASKWTQLDAPNGPSPRQNVGFDFDPTLGKFVLFGGFAANFYFSDLWAWDGTSWTVIPDHITFNRRRAARP